MGQGFYGAFRAVCKRGGIGHKRCFAVNHLAPAELKRTIDILVANKRKFDPATNRDLYTTYVGSKGTDDAAAYQVSQQLHAVLASAQQFLNTAIADNRTQIEAISEVADRSDA